MGEALTETTAVSDSKGTAIDRFCRQSFSTDCQIRGAPQSNDFAMKATIIVIIIIMVVIIIIPEMMEHFNTPISVKSNICIQNLLFCHHFNGVPDEILM